MVEVAIHTETVDLEPCEVSGTEIFIIVRRK